MQQVHVYGDKHKLGQVIRNLVSNALKFTPRDGTVTIKAECLVPKPEDPPPPKPHRLSSYGRMWGSGNAVSAIDVPSHRITHALRIQVTDTGAGISKVPVSKYYIIVI